MTELDKIKLDKLNDLHRIVIKNYCDEIGCEDCPVKIDDDECESSKLQDLIMEIEFRDIR